MSTGASYQIERVGVFRPKQEMMDALAPGEVGFFTAAIKEVADTRVGDTVTDARNPTTEALPGFKPAQPVVFCGLFPVDAADFAELREAMGRLRLNDASFSFEMETLGGARLRLPLRLPRACCTWRSSPSGSSASSTSTSSPRRRASSTTST